ncbi:MAG TPA: hypothetical protein VKD72_21005 [Gemmataceae bacterium]|nr:hypothetical protein [Gemmataceae bacterium]
MSRWYRVFGRGEQQPAPAALVECLRELGVANPAHFRGDEEGWTLMEVALAEGVSPLSVECFLTREPGIRAELNNWAAWLETCDYSPNSLALMERVIQARQLYAMRRPLDHADELRLEKVCGGICRFLAAATDGVYQYDTEGFFAADGTLLLQEY